MDMQEAFEKAYLGVLRQGKLAKGAYQICYRMADGAKCALGHLMSDEDLAKLDAFRLNSEAFHNVRDYVMLDLDLDFLIDLQCAHDRAKSLEDFSDRMKRVAEYFRLEMPEPQA